MYGSLSHRSPSRISEATLVSEIGTSWSVLSQRVTRKRILNEEASAFTVEIGIAD